MRGLLAEARGKIGRIESLFRVDLLGSFQEYFLRLGPIHIGDATGDGTNRVALFFIMKPDALRAELRIDDIDLRPLGDRLVGALRFTGSAVDAFLGDDSGHKKSTS